MTDLSLFPTADLVNELQSRFDVFALVARKHTSTAEYVDIKRYAGHRMIAIGLIQALSLAATQDELLGTIPLKNNEDR